MLLVNDGGIDQPALVLTIGHSTRKLDEFVRLLRANHVTTVVDIRTIPRSRQNPHFNRKLLPNVLESVAIRYRHMRGLGGLRRPLPDSPNTAWHNPSFRGFADYMQKQDFDDHLSTLVELASCEQVALMCAEVVPWRCHRSLIADALLTRNVGVEHSLSEGRRQQHVFTPWAHVAGTHVTYPARDGEGLW